MQNGKEREMRRIALLVAFFWTCWVVPSTFAVPLYGVSYEGNIYKIDQATSTRELFMINTGVSWMDATDGPTLDAFFATGEGGSLYSVDVVTKTLAAIGPYGSAVIKTLAYAESAIPGVGVLYGSDFQNLYTINTATGAAALVAPIHNGVDLFVGVQSMDYDPVANRLYIVNQFGSSSKLYYVDTATGFATLVGSLGGSIPVTDIWYDRDTGKMYGVHKSNTQLYEINTANGLVTPIGPTPSGSDACPNILGLGSVNVPEPGMLAVLGLGMLGLFPVVRRHRR
jgi:DNA-binding beta-propeller fold protein YncE